MIFKLVNGEKVNQFKDIPGPTPVFPFGNALDFRNTPLYEVFLRYSETYGDTTLFWLFSEPNILITGPELLEKMLATNMDDFYKKATLPATKPVFRTDMFVSNGADDWAWKRREHPFSQSNRNEQFNRLIPEVRGIIKEYFANLSEAKGEVNDLWLTILEMYNRVWTQGILGVQPEKQMLSDYQRIMDAIAESRAALITYNPSFWSLVKRWHGYFTKLLQQNSGRNEKNDILSQQLHRNPDLSSQEIQDQMSLMYIGGLHSATTTLFSVFFLLFHHPDVQQKLRLELEDFIRQHPENFTLEELNQLPYLDRVLNETLRVYSTVPFSRRFVEPNRFVKLGDYNIPENTAIWFCSWAVHRNSKYWSDPLKFDPDRFTKTPPPNHFFPFGIGPRECVGKPWATMALKLAIVTILPEYKVDVDPNYVYETKFGPGSFLPTKPLNARINRI